MGQVVDAQRWLELAPCAYLVTTLDGRIRWTNRTFAEWVGTRDGLEGRSIHDVLTPAGRIHFESVAPTLALNGKLTDVALNVRRSDGSVLHLLCNATAEPVADVADDDDMEVWWVGLDVSERHAYERELLVAQRRLRRLQDLSAALVGATTVTAVGEALLDRLVDGVKADDGAVFVVEGDGLVPVARKSTDGATDPSADRAVDDVHVQSVLTAGSAVFAADVDRFTAPVRTARAEGPWHVAALPLGGGGRLLGVVRLGLERQQPHTPDEQQLLRAAAEMTGQAIDRVQLFDRDRLQAERNRAASELLHAIEEHTTLADRAQLIADFAVPTHADYATVEILSAGRAPSGLRHRDRSLESTLRWLRTSVSVSPDQDHSLAAGREHRAPRVLNDIDESMYTQYDLDDEQLTALRTLGPTAYLGLPLIARGRVIGSLMLVQSSSGRRFSDADVAFFGRLADSCALALENARLYEHERGVAQELQTALLPKRLPSDRRVRLASFYEAGHELNMIGGDWYDAFELDGDRLGLVVGDVVGGGMGAATAMAQLRVAVRAYALDGRGVGDVLRRLNEFAATIEGAPASSVVYAELDLATNTMTFGCAGHPPPVLCTPGRPPEVRWEGRGSLLAVDAPAVTPAELELVPGSTVVFFTDGLVERRDRPLDEGLDALTSTLAADDDLVARPARLARAMDTLHHGDDACILTVTVGSPVPGA